MLGGQAMADMPEQERLLLEFLLDFARSCNTSLYREQAFLTYPEQQKLRTCLEQLYFRLQYLYTSAPLSLNHISQ